MAESDRKLENLTNQKRSRRHMTVDACFNLAQSSEGSSPLTSPFHNNSYTCKYSLSPGRLLGLKPRNPRKKIISVNGLLKNNFSQPPNVTEFCGISNFHIHNSEYTTVESDCNYQNHTLQAPVIMESGPTEQNCSASSEYAAKEQHAADSLEEEDFPTLLITSGLSSKSPNVKSNSKVHAALSSVNPLVKAYQENVEGGFAAASKMYDISTFKSAAGSQQPNQENSFAEESRNNDTSTSMSQNSGSMSLGSSGKKRKQDFDQDYEVMIAEESPSKLKDKKTRMYSPIKLQNGASNIYYCDVEDSNSNDSGEADKRNSKSDKSAFKKLFAAQKNIKVSKKAKGSGKGKKVILTEQQQKWLYSTEDSRPSASPAHKGIKVVVEEEYATLSSDDDWALQDLDTKTFGLLGEAVTVKKTCYFELLPDEVLQHIFCHLPLIDLCLNSNRVCRRWNDIISSHKFLVWKKKYFKLKKLRRSDSISSEIQSLMQENDMIFPSSYLVGLIRYMKCFKPVTAANMLECLQNHRLYSDAIALMQERLPDIFTLEKPSPWSLITVLVIISESVGDISLVLRVLTCPLSQCTTLELMECLYCILTFLQAFKMAKLHDIWNGIEYRLFYALYLYENESSSSFADLEGALKGKSGQQSILKYGKNETGVQLTHEQKRIVNHNCKSGEIIKIVAFAGTGKTTTLIKYTQLRPNEKFLLVVYNKSVCESSKTKFPSNVTCKTGHGLAYGVFGRRYQAAGKFTGRGPTTYSLTQTLEPRKGDNLFVRAKFVLDTINCFLNSADDYVNMSHVPMYRVDENGIKEMIDVSKKQLYVSDAQYIWNRMKDYNDKKVPMSHDGYLKLYQLSQPTLRDYDAILIDEAQDLTPAISDLLLRQSVAKILVGDPHQQIYSFRGAVNSMQQVQASQIFYLTQSFRFGPEIAQVAACCLESLKCEKTKTLVGNSKSGSILGEKVGQIAILTRSNSVLFDEAVKLCCYRDTDEKVAFVGGTDGFGFGMIMDIYLLMLPFDQRQKENREIENKLLRCFSSLGELEKYATKVMDNELIGKIKIVRKYNVNLPVLIKKILSKCVRDDRLADVVLSTAHKAKGLEFSTVKLTDDYVEIPSFLDESQLRVFSNSIGADELNLLYVAVTRAKNSLLLTLPLYRLLKSACINHCCPKPSKDLAAQQLKFMCNQTGSEFKPYTMTLYRKKCILSSEETIEEAVYSPRYLVEKGSSWCSLLGLTDKDLEKEEAAEELRRNL